VIDEIFAMAKNAGFHNIELNQGFFVPEIRERVLELLKANQLKMPSVYVGGAMHATKLADQTIATALEIGEVCRPFGCKAIVNNPSPLSPAAEKSDAELAQQAEALNRLGRALKEKGFELRVHHHTPELVNNAREWRHILHNTDPSYVAFCLDLDWAHQGGFEPLDLLKEAGSRVGEVHVRNSKDKLWLEALDDGDVDYRQVARYFRVAKLRPLIVVELAYRDNTTVTRPLGEDLRLSRIYAEKIFGVQA
jgi:inosose dehydratase